MSHSVVALDIAAAAQLACLLEVSAPKPGNVSPGRHFRDARYEDFLASSIAVGPALGTAGDRSLGETIHRAVEGTRTWTLTNTNLGIVLLLAPLARAAARTGVPVSPDTLRVSVRGVLTETTVDDAREAYAAIRLAAPGGLGRTDAQDVAAEPTVPLLDAMRLAAHRDRTAREYDSAFATTFTVGVPTLDQALRDGLAWEDAIVETFLSLLADAADTHIGRRAGEATAARVSEQARTVLNAGGVRSPAGRAALQEMDAGLRDARNSVNPGTTADLTAAAIFVALLGGAWHRGKEGRASNAAVR